MYIKSNIEISEGSVKEFVRVLIPEAMEKKIELEYETTNENIVVKIKTDGKSAEYSYNNYESKIEDEKIILAKTSLLRIYGKEYSWGGLIGVRPTKVIKRLLLLGYSEKESIDILKEIYLVSEEKAQLLLKIFLKEKTLMNREAYSIYIGIPFCPSKCRYCSFASFELGSPVGERYYKPFVETLLEEIKLTGELIKENGYKIESIYIGGGTPSTLTEKDLEKVLKALELHIDKTHIKEFTFEAGREDSITDRKLEIAKEYGVDRVSLNPQTFKLETLENLNRKFNRENFDRCYKKIKELGFILNMDLILGLPGEKEEDILKSLEEIKKYDIENLTIHSLALKKASTLFKDEDGKITDLEREHIEEGIKKLVFEKNLFPYYMYRQKNSAHWGENIGYSKEGFESIFNIEMIEENQSTIGLGGGAITKKITEIDPFTDEIKRLVNPKEPATYIREMKERFNEKLKLFSKILTLILFMISFNISSYSEGKFIFGANTLEEKDLRLDVNSSTYEEMLAGGITTNYAKKIIEYKKITGGISELKELSRISGIGDATVQNLSKKLKIDKKFIPKKIKINSNDEKKLIYFGFSKDEVKKIKVYRGKNGDILSNIPLMDIIAPKKYEKYRDMIDYGRD